MNEAPSDQLRDVYERRAELEYARPVALDPSVARKFERIRELVLEHMPCESFLDAGCGDGRYLGALGVLAERPRRIVGVDISERILLTAKATVETAGLDAELVRANLEALPFEDGAFDLVLCSQVVEHVLDPTAGLREVARVTRPGGTLIVSTDNRRNLVTRAINAPRTALVSLLRLGGRLRRVEFPHRAFDVDQFCALVREAGFEVGHVETFRFHLRWPLDRPALQRLLNRIEKALPPHRMGDIIVAVARRRAR